MESRFKRIVKSVSIFLAATFVIGVIPWREIRADMNTHGEYDAYPFDVVYDQVSTWNNSTQGEFKLTNTSDYTITSWSIEVDYFDETTITNIWNAKDITDYSTDENIIIQGNISISSGETYSFGLIAEGVEEAPIAPLDVRNKFFESDVPSDENTEDISESEEYIEVPASEPTEEEANPTIFPYAIFAASTSSDYTFSGWKSNIVGDIYTGKDFVYNGSELYVDGTVQAAGSIKTYGWKTEITEKKEGTQIIEIPDWSEAIWNKQDMLPEIKSEDLDSKQDIVANGFYYSEDSITISGTNFTGDAVIISKGDITYNVESLNADEEATGRVLLYSEEGNITINGSKIELNGLLYAPNGKVSINAYDTTLNGRIICDRFSYSGSILNVQAADTDLQLVQDLPEVTVTAVQDKVYVGETASFKIDIPTDNVFEILYRLNGEDVTVDLPENEEDLILFSFSIDSEGEYIFEAYVVIPTGEVVLDTGVIVASLMSTSTPTLAATDTPTPTATNTPTPTATRTPTPTITPVETNTPIPTTSTPTAEPTVTVTPTVQPTDTPVPTELPLTEQERYFILSQGDDKYGYKNDFIYEDWAFGYCTSYDPKLVTMCDFIQGGSTSVASNFTREFGPDYSFSGRFTLGMEYNNPEPANAVELQIRSASGKSFIIEIDYSRDEDRYWRDNNGVWHHSETPYECALTIDYNDYAYYNYGMMDFNSFLDNGSINEVWFEYDGVEEIFYLYAAQYEENGNINKDVSPSIICPVSFDDLFEGEHELEIKWAASTNYSSPVKLNLYGIELDPYPDIHSLHNDSIEIIDPSSNRLYEVGDEISVNGKINKDIEVKDAFVKVADSNGSNVYENTIYPKTTYSLLDTIPTTDLLPGNYKVTIDITDVEGIKYVKDTSLTLVKNSNISAEISEVVFAENELKINGTALADVSATYVLKYRFDDSLYWTQAGSGSANIKEGVLGKLDLDKLIGNKIHMYLSVTTVTGRTVLVDKDIVLDIPTPSITVTPTPFEVEFNEDELFADISNDQDGSEVTFITDIKGTVTGTKLKEYTLEAFPVGSEDRIYIFTGTTEVKDGTVGTIDPTLLMNGYYKVVLTAVAEEGCVEDSIVVLVTGQAKIGNYSLTFLDMTLPVSGLPVEVYRTYDSRQKSEEGDFGYGWTMSIGGPKISYSGDLSCGWEYQKQPLLLVPQNVWKESYPHEVYIDWGNGKTETFVMSLSPEKWLDVPVGQIAIDFINADGTSDTLEILGENNGLSYDVENGALLDGEFKAYEPKKFLLTRYDGMKFYFDVETGLYKVEDTYGRTIEITEDGIIYSEGGSIAFNKDAEGRITSITDGLGNKVVYTYDKNGDLVGVKDIGGYNTTFGYDDSHFITDITSDNGTKIARNEYDEDGRLVATIDADGNRIEFEHDLENKMEVTTNRLGYSTVYYYDENGNVTKIVDALGRVTTYTYDSNNNKTSETRPDDTTFNFTYDENGNLVTSSDDHGRTISSTYGSNGELLTMSAMGVTELTMAYDEHGNLITATDSEGNIQNYGYSSKGELISVSDSLGTLMSMTYDADGHIISVTDPEGQVTNFSYDAEGRMTTRSTTYQGTTLTDTYTYDSANRVTKITYANGNTVSYTYNQAGDVVSSTDSQGRTVNYTYDIYGNLTKITYPDGTSESFTYDLEGNNLTATDRMGRTATFTYDAVGNCISKTYANGATEEYSYDCCDRLETVTNVYGGITTYGYDYLGRNTSVTDAKGNTTTYTYNDRGNVASVTDALGNTYTFTYDNNGNQTSVTYPNGSTYESTYDARGRLTSQSDAYGNVTSYSYDGIDRLVAVTDALGNTWNYTYDEIGNLTSVTDAKKHTTTYEYDVYGKLISVTNAAGNSAATDYDKYGRVISTTDFGGVETEYTYDSMDRVITSTTNGVVTEYTYDKVGNLIRVEDPTGVISYSYNSDGYLSGVKNAEGESIFYEYNEAGQVSSIKIDGKVISYDYDIMGRLISVTDSEGTTSYTYDKVGNRVSTTYPNGVKTTYEYNEINVLTKLVTKNASGEILQSYEYTIGANGERLSVVELNRTVEYGYDELERLVLEKVTSNGTVSLTTYAYDSNSNRISMNKNGEITTYEYNELDQITKAGDTEYTWDNAGNLICQSSKGTLIATYTYDCHNRMVTANVNTSAEVVEESYTYDYLGNRTSKTTNGVTTKFVTDLTTGYSQVLKVKSGTDSVYYTRGFELISKSKGSETSYYIYDGELSVRGLTNESGILTDTLVFDAFGNEIERTGTTDNSYGFQGEEKDATGLYYLRARYMDPTTGTFPSMDTYGGRISDPMSLHKYLFANSNPIRYCDPSGHSSTLVECIEVCAIVGMLAGEELYLLNCFWSGNEVTPLGVLGSAIAGAAITIAVFLVIYGCFILYYVFLAYLLPGAEMVNKQLNETGDLTTSQSTRVGEIVRKIQDHLTFKDFTGAIRDLLNFPILRSDGSPWQHLKEVSEAIGGLERAIESLNRMLKNPNLTPGIRNLLENAENVSELYIEYFKMLMERLR